MKILQVIHNQPFQEKGGTEIYTKQLCKELSKNHDVYIFYPKFNVTHYSINLFKVGKIKVIELSLPYYEKIKKILDFKSSYLNVKIEKKFNEILNKIKPQIVHFQHLINLSASLINITYEKNIPTILTLHDYWFICPRAFLLRDNLTICNHNDIQAKNCLECWINGFLKNFFTNKPLLLKTLKKIIQCLGLNKEDFNIRKNYMLSLLLKVDKIISPSKFLQKIFLENGLSKHKILHSENGYDLNRFIGFNRKKPSKEKMMFGFIGNFAERKGVETLIKTFNMIKNEKVELKIYGYNQNSIFSIKFRKKIKNPRIKLMGEFNNVKEPFSNIDILIFPSICLENCPLVLLEALIAKIPVIASNLASIPEFIIHEKNGLLFEAGNPYDLHEKVNRFIDDPILIERLSNKNVKNVKPIGEQAKEFEKIYENLI